MGEKLSEAVAAGDYSLSLIPQGPPQCELYHRVCLP